MYAPYSGAVSNQERLMMACVRYIKMSIGTNDLEVETQLYWNKLGITNAPSLFRKCPSPLWDRSRPKDGTKPKWQYFM